MNVRIRSDLDDIVFTAEVLLRSLVHLLLGLIHILLVLLQTLNRLFGSSYHIVFRIKLILPVDDLINTESNGGAYFC